MAFQQRIRFLFFLIFIFILAGCTTVQKNSQIANSSEAATVEEQNSSKLEHDDLNLQATNKIQSEGKLQVHFIDVGQGASQLIIGPTGKTILIDAGNNNMEKTVVGYLKEQGITKVDILIGTHPDADHIGGLDKVIDNFDIGKIYLPKVQSNTKTFESVLLSVQNKGLKITTAKAGLTLDWEQGIDVKMIAPVNTYNDTNEMSAVVHLTYDQTAFLFTGDAEAKSETDMLSSGANLKADVLLVGHHGSDSSTSMAFLDEVNPTYGMIQSGKDNSYGHPTADVLKRLHDQGIKIYRNDKHGNIVFFSNGKNISVAENPWKFIADDNHATVSKPKPEDVGQTEFPQDEGISGELMVHASIDNVNPTQNSTVTVKVEVKDEMKKPVNDADVKVNVRFKSKDTIYEGKTNQDGIADLSFKISRAAKDFTVIGEITVNYDNKTSNAEVSFTPQ